MDPSQKTDRSSSKKQNSYVFFASLLSSGDESTSSGLLEFQIVVAKLARLLLAIAIFLFLMSIVVGTLKYDFGYVGQNGNDKSLVHLFDLDSESNIPTIYSSWLLLACSIVLSLIAALKHNQRDRFRWHWKGLAIIFLVMSIDELASVHENLVEPLHRYLKVDGIWHFTWVIPGLCFVVFLGIAYFKFLLALPRKIGSIFLISGGIYLSGALASEMIGGVVASTVGDKNLFYSLVTNVEEFLEMVGLVLFINALLRYLQLFIHTIQISLGHHQFDQSDQALQDTD